MSEVRQILVCELVDSSTYTGPRAPCSSLLVAPAGQVYVPKVVSAYVLDPASAVIYADPDPVDLAGFFGFGMSVVVFVFVFAKAIGGAMTVLRG